MYLVKIFEAVLKRIAGFLRCFVAAVVSLEYQPAAYFCPKILLFYTPFFG
jgi:hypothetical protein